MKQKNVAALNAVAFLALSFCRFAAAQEASPILGVLEDTPGHYAGDPHYRSVRVVFAKQGKQWIAFPSKCPNQECLKSVVSKYPEQMNWTVAFGGKDLGTLSTKRPEKFDFYATIGQELLANGKEAPTIGKPSVSFSGYVHEPVYRPLVTNSHPFFKDPEGWKRAQLNDILLARIREQFRRKFPKAWNCSTARDTAKPWHYSDDNIKVMAVYSSNRNYSVVQVQLTPCRCDFCWEKPFIDQWFVVAPDSTINLLGTAMWLVDAGDYDSDGHSELIFSIDDDNRGGYKLFYDNFRGSTVFSFHHH